MKNIQKLIELKKQILEVRNDHWFNDVLFTFNWWFLLVLSIAPWVLWWRIVDRGSLLEISLYGSLISIYSILLDDIGSYFVLWIYQYQLVPVSPRLNPVDLTIMPVTYMFVYQFFRKWKTFLIAQTILAFGASFLTEPLFTWMDIYKPLNWKFIYSFIIYILLGVLNKGFVTYLVKIQLGQGRQA